jgi:precorrin-4/cobalt-precorrin-4 C11-methyltransferase
MGKMPKVYFIGAGPGDPELLTIKGQKLLEQADVIVYTGSLLHPSILNYTKPKAHCYDSATMNLDQIVRLISRNVRKGKRVVRLCSGDPSIYGATQEQIDQLESRRIDCEVIPGVSSFLAAAAHLKRELTLPGVSQTVIITRPGGRTPTLRSEEIANLAKHHATMVIFLGVNQIQRLCRELTRGGYPKKTPVAVLYKVTWPEESIIRGTIRNIVSKVKRSTISKTALVIIGGILSDGKYSYSKLYDPSFTHAHRKGKAIQCSEEASQ